MSNFSKILEHLLTFSEEGLRKGKIFERYCKWFLENDPRYAMQLKKVWLWDEWPENWGRDKGIDLIAESHSGEIWAIQAKAYHENYYVTKDDVDKFLSESSRKQITYRLLIGTTNLIGPNALEVLAAQEKQARTCLLDNLEASSVDWSQALNNPNAPLKKEIHTPWPHQERALNDILIGLEKSSYGQLYMACGTGKTLVGLWLAEALKSNTTLVLVPSISLIAQLYREWSNHSGETYNFYPIFICSDITVSKKGDEDDQSILNSAELGFPVTTNAQELVDQLSHSSRPKVIFATYHSSPVVAEACKIDSSLVFDLTIADEAHRCAGSANSDFATIVDKEAIRTKHKIFMTATPKIFTDRVKKTTKEYDYDIVLMDDPDKFGPIFHKLSFSDAIKDDLLSDYQVIISVIDNKTHQEYAERGRFVVIDDHETDARTLASQILMAKAITKHNLTRIISFHSRTKGAKTFIDSLPKALELLNENERPLIGFKGMISGDMLQSERNKLLRRFKELTPGSVALLANVRCLSEGVDVKILDGIAFIDPKGSEIDIVQAVGRVIRKSPDKKIGTIIIPIFVDGLIDEETALEQSCFKTIWRVVKALKAHDDVLAEELDNLRLELGKKTSKKQSKISKITIDIPVNIGIEFGQALQTKIVENCSRLSLAQEYPEVALQWHPSKNGNLKPEDVTAGSNKKIWWKCPKGGDHEWQVTILSRTIGSGCSICGNRLLGISNSLAIKYPDLAQQWHPLKNILTTEQVIAGKHTKRWWKCPKGDDHEWQASIISRIRGSSCPICLRRIVVHSNCLATTNPNLVQEWHPPKNGNLTPYDVTIGSHTKAWWKCSKGDDHEWEAPIKDRQRFGCGVCAGKKVAPSNCLATSNPDLAQEWHPTKNGTLKPDQVHVGSHTKVWWKCPKGDDHEWEATIKGRKKSSCPICAGKKAAPSNCLATSNPDLAQEWHPSKNGNLTPYDVTVGSNKKVWWQCPKGNDHEWQAPVISRRNQNCAVCASKKVVTSNCLATTNPDIAQEWHLSKNGDLTPYNVTAGSNKKVWWKCPKGNDHEWQTSVHSRQNKNCAICASRKVVPSSCLSTTHPNIAKEWHHFKNDVLTPDQVHIGSHKKVWWKCPRGNDHEWQAAIRDRKKTGCPACAGKLVALSNCLATNHPKLALQWHQTKNGNLTPYDVTTSSGEKVWWRCPKRDDHEWQAKIYNRTVNESGCPQCYKIIF